MRKFLSAIALVAVTFTGIVTMATPAAAVSPTANLFALNIANQDSGSGASNFYSFHGKTYFTASTMSKGTALWSVDDGNYTKAPELVYDPFAGNVSGRISNLYGSDHFLFFWTQHTYLNQGYPLYVLDVNTGVVKPVKNDVDPTLEIRSGDWGWNLDTTADGEIYGMVSTSYVGNDPGYDRRLVHFNKADGTFTDLGTMTFNPDWGITAVGKYIYTFKNPWGSWTDTENRKAWRYDTSTNTWSDNLTYANGTTVIDHITNYGKFM